MRVDHISGQLTARRRPRWRLLAAGLAACLGVALVGTAIPAQAATLTQVTGFGTNPGNLLMYRYVPDGLAANRPVVVAIHGCSQSAALYDNESGWTKWADQHQFALVLPQQKTQNNPGKCSVSTSG